MAAHFALPVRWLSCIRKTDAALGTCRQLSVGPEAALSLITGQAITAFIAEEVHAHGEMSPGQKLKLAMVSSLPPVNSSDSADAAIRRLSQLCAIPAVSRASVR